MMWRAAGAAAIALALVASAACDGDGDGDGAVNGDEGTPRASSTVAGTGTQSAPQPTRTPAPISTAGAVDSSDLGYTAQLPEGWRSTALEAPEGSRIDFFSGPADQGLPPTIVVRCDENAAPDSVQTALTATARVDAEARIAPAATVAGQEATVVEYRAGTGALLIDKRDVLFKDGRCAWTISLSVAAGRMAEFDAAFNAFLASFSTGA